MKKVILHCDLNNFYASVECMKNPNLKGKCVAVCGEQDNRHGIVLAKSERAKAFGVKTGDAIWEAKRKCPSLICVPPHFHEYLYLSKMVKEIYAKYSDRVESFGIDEAWIDVSESVALFGDGVCIANAIQQEVEDTLGLTISIGISDNKIYAKLGSDFKKPNAITVFHREEAEHTFFHLPVESLLYVGKATKKKLNALYIYTIGHLAHTPRWFLAERLGKMGEVLHDFANGIDLSEVSLFDLNEKRKSFGNGITPKKDLKNIEEAKLIIYILSDSIAKRMRKEHYEGGCVSIHFRSKDLVSFSRQTKLEKHTNLCHVIAKEAIHLCEEHYSFHVSMRSMSIHVSELIKEKQYYQMSFLEEEDTLQSLERCIDTIQEKYGLQSIKRACYLVDEELTSFSPYEDHVIFPQNYFK